MKRIDAGYTQTNTAYICGDLILLFGDNSQTKLYLEHFLKLGLNYFNVKF